MKPDKTALDRWLDVSIDEMEFSLRARNTGSSLGVATIRDLVLLTDEEVLASRGFAETTLREVTQRLNERGLRLGMRIRSGEWTYGDEP